MGGTPRKARADALRRKTPGPAPRLTLGRCRPAASRPKLVEEPAGHPRAAEPASRPPPRAERVLRVRHERLALTLETRAKLEGLPKVPVDLAILLAVVAVEDEASQREALAALGELLRPVLFLVLGDGVLFADHQLAVHLDLHSDVLGDVLLRLVEHLDRLVV